MLPDPLRTNLQNLIHELQQPPSADEAAGGWDAALKIRWADWFVKLRSDLEAKQKTPAGWGILRAMDADGVSATPLAKRANAVGRLVDEWKSTDQP